MSADEVFAAVRASGLLQRGRPVVAMLSGGRDSVCLVDLAARLCGPENVSALHVNYGLRADADADERHCVELCERLGVELEVVHATRAPTARRADCAGAMTPRTRISATRARACAMTWWRLCAPCTRRPRPTCCARRSCCARRRSCWTPS